MTGTVISIATGRTWEGEAAAMCHEEPGSVPCHIKRGAGTCPGAHTLSCYSTKRTARSLNPHIPELFMGSVVFIPPHF